MAFNLPPINIPILGKDEFTKVFRGVGKQIQSAGREMASIGKTLTASITLPVAAMGYTTLKTAGEFEAAMNSVGVATKGSAEDMAKLTRQARDLGASTIFSAKDAAAGMELLSKAGFDVNQVMGAMPGVMDLAAAAKIDVATAAGIAEDALGGFNIPAERMSEVNDMLVASTRNSEATLAELGEGLRIIAPLASTIGLSLEETSAALALLSNEGLKGSEAAAVLRQGLAKLSDPSKEMVDTFQKLGVRKGDLIDAKGNVKGLTEVITVLEKSGAGAAEIMQIFGARAGPGMAALLKGGSAGLKNLTAEIAAAAGKGGAAEVAGKQTEGFNGSLGKLKSSFEELQLAIASSGLLDFATMLVGKVSEVVTWLGQLNPTLLRVGTIIAIVAAAIGPLLVGLGSFVALFGSLLVLFANPAFIAAMSAIGGLAGSFAAALVPLALIVAAILIWNHVFKLIAEDWVNMKDSFTDFRLFVETMKFLLADVLGPVAKFVGLGKYAGGAPAGAPVGATGAVAGAAGATSTTRTNNAAVDVNFRNAPPGMRANVASGEGVTLNTEAGLLLAGGF